MHTYSCLKCGGWGYSILITAKRIVPPHRNPWNFLMLPDKRHIIEIKITCPMCNGNGSIDVAADERNAA